MIVMLFILYTSYQRYKYDKSFWEKQDEISEEFLKHAKAMNEADCAVCAECECEANESKE
jgi:hypothetical protein